MSGPKNTILSDSLPYQLPDVKDLKSPKQVNKSDFAKLGTSRKYKEIDKYIEVRKEYYRHFLPGGSILREVAITDPTKAGNWAGLASTIIDELEQLQLKIQSETSQ